MATKKDLVEAYSFSRRRLVTAFVSGAPGGREVEPTRPGRAIVGGLAIALLLVAGGAVLGVIRSPSNFEWTDGTLISDRDSGALYLVLKQQDSDATEVRPLLNITTAYLLLGSEVKTTKVPREDIAEQPPGDSIGILGAPQVPPATDRLVQSGWTACTGVIGGPGPTGIRLRISPTPDDEVTPAPDSSFVVSTPSGGVYLVAQARAGFERGERAYAYPVPDSPVRSRIVTAVAGTSEVVEVPEAWVGLFPAGRELSLRTLGIGPDQLGARWGGAASVPGAEAAAVGDLLVDAGGTTYLVTPSQVIVLDEFALTLYRELDFPDGRQPRTFEVEQGPGTVTDMSAISDAYWPTDLRRDNPPTDQLCARLDVEDDKPGVVLATVADGSTASSEGLGPLDEDVSVEPGHGAFVFSGDFVEGGETRPFLVDSRGVGYPVGTGDERAQLGYAGADGVEDVVVPNSWIELLDPGVPLTIDAASCPPVTSLEQDPCS